MDKQRRKNLNTGRIIRRVIAVLITLVVVVALVAGAVLVWYTNRPRPDPVERTLFNGVEYTREIYDSPRPYIVHIVRINLNTSEPGFLVTPAEETDGYDFPARTTSQFLEEFDLQLAINGDFFNPWRDNGPWDTYPQVGDGVSSRGLSITHGTIHTRGYVPEDAYGTLYIMPENRVSFDLPGGEVAHAISGFPMLLRDGVSQIENRTDAYLRQPHPRTAVGIAGDTLILVLVDGRQPNYSEGVTLPELTDIFIKQGATDALNLDGGGSVTLVIEDAQGEPDVLNSPIHNRIPGRERPIANHLGVYVRE